MGHSQGVDMAMQTLRTLLLVSSLSISTGVGQEPAESFAQLIEHLERGDTTTRRSAARTLGQLGSLAFEAVDPLVEALTVDDAGLRRRAAWALGRIGDPRAVPALAAALGDKDARYFAAAALGRIGPPAKAAVPELIRLLKIRKEGVRDIVALALGEIGPDAVAAVPALIEALGSRGDLCCIETFALDQYGSPRTLPALLEILEQDPGVDPWTPADEHERSSVDVVHALSGRKIYNTAVWALWRIGPKAVPDLTAALERALDEEQAADWETEDVGVSVGRTETINFCLGALGLIGPDADSSLPTLLRAYRMDSPYTDWVKSAVVGIGPRAVPFLVTATTGLDSERQLAVLALREIAATVRRADVPLLRELAEHRDPRVRKWVAGALKRLRR